MEAMVHDKPHKRRTFAKHCSKAFVLGMSTEHYRCWKFWTVSMQATCISGAAFFKHKYLTNPGITPEDQVIAAASRLTKAIQGTITTNMHTSTLKSLDDLQQIFRKAAEGCDTLWHQTKTTIQLEAPHQPPETPKTPNKPNTPTQSPREPPRVQTIQTPNIVTYTLEGNHLTEVSSPVPVLGANGDRVEGAFPAIRANGCTVEGVVSRQARQKPLPKPNSPEPRRSQRLADLGKPALCDALAANTRSQTQACTITQEAILACISTYSDITNRRLTASNAAHRKFPTKMLSAVLTWTLGNSWR